MTQNEENTPKIPVKPPLGPRLMAKLEQTLDEAYSTLPTGVMVEHANILDMAFRRGIHYALTGGVDATVFQAALKAQNQYRHTVKALESLDDKYGARKKT